MTVTTVVRMLSGSSWKSADYWTEVGWSADVWVRLTVHGCMTLICIHCRQCLLYGIFVYKWPHLFIAFSVYFVIIKNCFVVAASYPFLLASGVTLPIFFRAWGNNTIHFQNELKETLVWCRLCVCVDDASERDLSPVCVVLPSSAGAGRCGPSESRETGRWDDRMPDSVHHRPATGRRTQPWRRDAQPGHDERLSGWPCRLLPCRICRHDAWAN